MDDQELWESEPIVVTRGFLVDVLVALEIAIRLADEAIDIEALSTVEQAAAEVDRLVLGDLPGAD